MSDESRLKRMIDDSLAYQDCWETKPVLTRLSDPKLAEKTLSISRETSYRRGFTQGAAAAHRAMEAGKASYEIQDWVTDLYLNWRCVRHNGKIEFPNEL